MRNKHNPLTTNTRTALTIITDSLDAIIGEQITSDNYAYLGYNRTTINTALRQLVTCGKLLRLGTAQHTGTGKPTVIYEVTGGSIEVVPEWRITFGACGGVWTDLFSKPHPIPKDAGRYIKER